MADKRARGVKESFPKAKSNDDQSIESTFSKRFPLSSLLLITMFFVGCILLVASFAALTFYFSESLQLQLFWFGKSVFSLPVILGAIVAITALLAFGYNLLKQRLRQENDVNAPLPPELHANYSEPRGEQSIEGHSLVEAAPGQETSVVLDYELLLDNMDGDRDAVQMLLEIFQSEHLDDASLLCECLECEQTENACRIAHSLKGVASGLEARPLRLIAEQIERAIRQGETIHDDALVQLAEAITAVNCVIERHLQPETSLGDQTEESAADEETCAVNSCETRPVESVNASGMRFSDSRCDSFKEALLPILNIEYLVHSMDDDLEAVSVLLEIFVSEHADDTTKLASLVGDSASDGICEKALRLVHSLKGVSGNIGAEALKQQAEAIEAKYKQQQEVTDSEYGRLGMLLEKTVEEASRYLAELPAETV